MALRVLANVDHRNHYISARQPTGRVPISHVAAVMASASQSRSIPASRASAHSFSIPPRRQIEDLPSNAFLVIPHRPADHPRTLTPYCLSTALHKPYQTTATPPKTLHTPRTPLNTPWSTRDHSEAFGVTGSSLTSFTIAHECSSLAILSPTGCRLVSTVRGGRHLYLGQCLQTWCQQQHFS